MSLRLRLFLAVGIVLGLSLWGLLDLIVDDVRPRYLETMEEGMIDSARVLAELAVSHFDPTAAGEGVDDVGVGTGFDEAAFAAAFAQARAGRFEASIYQVVKRRVQLHCYVTDARGIVLFDSRGTAVGQDYSRWNDVFLTLQGRYGARATRVAPDDPRTTILYVAAPIRRGEELLGVLTVVKPTDAIHGFMDDAEREILYAGIIAGVALLVLVLLVTLWITQPVRRLTAYAERLGRGERLAPPKVGGSDLGRLATTYQQLIAALDGKAYVERYVQNLTHEFKSPLSAIVGAVEILQDAALSDEERTRFLGNIARESGRLRDLVDRLLQLAAVENQQGLSDPQRIDLLQICEAARQDCVEAAASKQLGIVLSGEPVELSSDAFLLRRAVGNLLQNAIDFSPVGGEISLALLTEENRIGIRISDAGDGIPAFALERVFERFYSLPRPGGEEKSTGIGLAFVREVASLHGGSVSLANAATGGAIAELWLPRRRSD